MLLLHAYPHNHHNEIVTLTNKQSIVVAIEFKLQVFSNDVCMEMWSNIDGTWKSYDIPYIIDRYGISSRHFDTINYCKQTKQIHSIKIYNHDRKIGFYSNYIFVGWQFFF